MLLEFENGIGYKTPKYTTVGNAKVNTNLHLNHYSKQIPDKGRTKFAFQCKVYFRVVTHITALTTN